MSLPPTVFATMSAEDKAAFRHLQARLTAAETVEGTSRDEYVQMLLDMWQMRETFCRRYDADPTRNLVVDVVFGGLYYDE